MSSHPQLLNAAPDPSEATRLRRENAGLERELADAKAEALAAKQAAAEAIQAIRALRKQFEPLYTALRVAFGEIARVDADPIVEQGPMNNTMNTVWMERIAKSKDSHARVLQVMLDGGGPMSLQQIRNASGTSSNASKYLNELLAKNWVQKLGHGSWGLK
jgi:hypothetical protein